MQWWRTRGADHAGSSGNVGANFGRSSFAPRLWFVARRMRKFHRVLSHSIAATYEGRYMASVAVRSRERIAFIACPSCRANGASERMTMTYPADDGADTSAWNMRSTNRLSRMRSFDQARTCIVFSRHKRQTPARGRGLSYGGDAYWLAPAASPAFFCAFCRFCG